MMKRVFAAALLAALPTFALADQPGGPPPSGGMGFGQYTAITNGHKTSEPNYQTTDNGVLTGTGRATAYSAQKNTSNNNGF